MKKIALFLSCVFLLTFMVGCASSGDLSKSTEDTDFGFTYEEFRNKFNAKVKSDSESDIIQMGHYSYDDDLEIYSAPIFGGVTITLFCGENDRVKDILLTMDAKSYVENSPVLVMR